MANVKGKWVRGVKKLSTIFRSFLLYKITSQIQSAFKNKSIFKKEIKTLVSISLCVLVAQSCLTLCDTMDRSPPGSSVHGILQARILGWVALPFSRGSSWPRDQTWVAPMAGRLFYHMSHQESLLSISELLQILIKLLQQKQSCPQLKHENRIKG